MSERAPCRSCLGRLGKQDRETIHARCLRRLFGKGRLPVLDVDFDDLNAVGRAMIGRTSISGVQAKLALGFDGQTLSVESAPTRYILKPQERDFAHVPENEHLTMTLAARAGFDVPPVALLELEDGSLALIEKRFDRTDDGHRLAVEDFCQLAELLPADKYSGSAELCVKLIQRYSAAPLLDLRTLFLQFLFSWWVGNGDLHLKNLSLLSARPNEPRLSPIYDLLNTGLHLPGDALALSVSGKKKNLKPKSWIELAERCQLPPTATRGAVQKLLAGLPEAVETVDRSFLSPEMKMEYTSALNERSVGLGDLVEELGTR